ncbi:hypothetical protein ZWY2020_048009 [Hordeum vulgare]|nr:hypothetical protein ZWY2020_048009 [Hordeum vulgare]
MAPDAVVLALSFVRPSHQPDPEHLNRIHPSRRARDPPEPVASPPLFILQAGHALVGSVMPEYDPVAKISIIPRGLPMR